MEHLLEGRSTPFWLSPTFLVPGPWQQLPIRVTTWTDGKPSKNLVLVPLKLQSSCLCGIEGSGFSFYRSMLQFTSTSEGSIWWLVHFGNDSAVRLSAHSIALHFATLTLSGICARLFDTRTLLKFAQLAVSLGHLEDKAVFAFWRNPRSSTAHLDTRMRHQDFLPGTRQPSKAP
jgi:hypothetical protein